MQPDQWAWLVVGVLAVACLTLSVATVRARRAADRERERGFAALEDLRSRLDALERDRTSPTSVTEAGSPAEFVITGIPAERSPSEPTSVASGPVRIDGPAFADTVLRETVVKAASLAHGVRRGLAPATRNRIRFEMKQEVRRARKQRKAEAKQAVRDLHARQRATLAQEAEVS